MFSPVHSSTLSQTHPPISQWEGGIGMQTECSPLLVAQDLSLAAITMATHSPLPFQSLQICGIPDFQGWEGRGKRVGGGERGSPDCKGSCKVHVCLDSHCSLVYSVASVVPPC